VNIIVSNLVSNLKQRPLEFNSKEAADIFSEAEDLLKMGERKEAKKLFMRAKETDKLRFRAPHAFNDVINVLLKDNEIIKIDSIFYSKSEKGITGFDLFVDHLHPNLKGYKLMADAFFEKIESDIRRKKISGVSPESIENYLDKNFPMTRFDSTFSRIKIDILLNSFPFTERTDYNPADFKTENFADTVAMKAVKGEMGWASSHLMLFNYFMRKNEFKKAFSELYTLMEARPFYKSALKNSIAKMLEKNRLYDAKHILVRNHRRYPDAFTSKNLGIINLKQGNISLAERLLKEASSYNPEDAEIQFLLARAQYAGRKVDQAIASMETCLKLNPEYPNAKGILQKLRNIKSKR
jgi:tetratricopeptide (TPR) repeat protein